MGVKSLWQLLAPVGRPVALETMEGTTMAIDSSIWIYQFQATMRDKQGKVLSNAHLLGFLRRISKLLFYGMKPVFVFDGGAPALKKNTLNERRKKKAGAATSHVKLAEKLLAAQMRREAVKHAQSKGKGKAPPVVLDENTVYLEDIDPSLPKASPRKADTPSKPKFRDHDPYRLPDVDLEDKIAKATSSLAPDPRLATEDELRTFIEEMRPEDFDVTSPAFRELPTEVQYEIVGDLRLKSRQTSYTRLQQMLKSARTPLDFSKQQIKNLQQRNTLTQQLLTTTDSIGKAHISIPVRIASERNKEYVLVKNESGAGGWILGIRDHGSKQKPIVLDHEDHSGDEDEDMEEVDIPAGQDAVDPDLREYRRGMALSAIARRYSPKKLSPLQSKSIRRDSKPLFDLDAEEASQIPVIQDSEDEEDDVGLAYAIQESLDQKARNENDYIPASSRLETALSIANASPTRLKPRTFGQPAESPSRPVSHPSPFKQIQTALTSSLSEDRHIDEGTLTQSQSATSGDDMEELPIPLHRSVDDAGPPSVLPQAASDDDIEELPIPIKDKESSDDDMEEVVVNHLPVMEEEHASSSKTEFETLDDYMPSQSPMDDHSFRPSSPIGDGNIASTSKTTLETLDEHIMRSRSQSPVGEDADHISRPSSPIENWDATQEMDPEAEEGDFAEFVSQVQGKDLDDVRREIEDEIAMLNRQKKAAMRDSEDVTQQMVSQIMMMLRLFGIPYITAPMEAEAQCAELVSLGLVDGIITDDSDVFLFGGERVFKNMFNQSKTVECFLLSDLSRELGLDRATLIRLAYLLGSDYVDGLAGVGPVVAMELLKEFPGEDGLHKFKEWWFKVQSGRDKEDDSKSAFRQRFKKKFKDLYLTTDWPNPAVRDAYYHPTVDDSEEPFKWGLPDLDALREFLRSELGWDKTKVDDLLVPIVKKMVQRSQASNANKQGNLNSFLNVVSGGSHAPRKRQAYASKRLQQVVSDFRKKHRNESVSAEPSDESEEVIEVAKKKATKAKGKRRRRQEVDDGDTGEGYDSQGGDLHAEATRPAKRTKRRATGKRKKADDDSFEDEAPLTEDTRSHQTRGRKAKLKDE